MSDFLPGMEPADPLLGRGGRDRDPLAPAPPGAPLAERMRPRSLDEYVGQEGLVAVLGPMLEAGKLPSAILWGPPGTGKTSLARLLAGCAGYTFEQVSGATSSKADVVRIVDLARIRRRQGGRTLLFVDEIHRFNKAQQDAFLPHVESGLVTLIGATTENPSFEVISPLLSRARVFVLEPLDDAALGRLVERALADSRGFGGTVTMEEGLAPRLVALATGDARKLLTLLELLADATPAEDGRRHLEGERLRLVLERDALSHDRDGDAHYQTISALHKSIRDSDVDAALYWLARMLEGGEDRRYLARRMVRMAIEDIGTADPQALEHAMACFQAYELLGSPEGEQALAQMAIYLALAPKSNAACLAYGAARDDVRAHGALPVPPGLRPASTALMRELGHGETYKYAHDYEDACVVQPRRPPRLEGRRYFHPVPRGFEKDLARRLAWWTERRAQGERKREG